MKFLCLFDLTMKWKNAKNRHLKWCYDWNINMDLVQRNLLLFSAFFFHLKWSEVECSESRSVMSNSLWLHGLYTVHSNTGVGSLSVLQGLFPTQGSNPGPLTLWGGFYPTPVFWPGEFHGLYNPWGHKESDTTEWLFRLNGLIIWNRNTF